MDSQGGEASDVDRRQGDAEVSEKAKDIDLIVHQQAMRLLLDEVMRADRESSFQIAEVVDRLEESGHLVWAERLMRKCIEIAEYQGQSPYWLCGFYSQLASILRRRGIYQEAEQWLRRANELADGIPLTTMSSWRVASEMAKLFAVQGRRSETNVWRDKAKVLWRSLTQKQARRQRGRPE